MIPYVTKHNSTSFKPKGLIIDGQEKKLSAEALVKIDVFGIGELVIRDNGINYKFGTKKLTGIRYNDQVYAYDEDLVRKIVRTYTNGSCYYCKRPVPITARNIVGLRKPMFILSCPYCQGLSQLWIERDRIKPVVIVKPTAVVEVETQYGIKYNVFPGSFKVLGDDEMQFYAHIISDHPPSTSPKKYFRYTVKAESPAIIHKTGVVIGASRTNNGKLCVEFDEGPLVGCGMGNSLRIVGKPFSCYWVHEDYLRENTEEVLREIEARKEQIEQERIDDWYGPEAYA